MAVEFARLYPDSIQLQAKNGALLTDGFVKVFLAGTDTVAETFCDYTGTRNPEKIIIDNNGRVDIICDKDRGYRVEVYDANGALLWTEEPVFCTGGGGGATITDIVSTNGSVTVDKSTVGGTVTYDLGIAPADSPEFLEWSTGFRGNMTYGTDKVPNYSAGTMSFDQYGVMVYKDRYYHITNKFYIKPLGTGTNYETFEVALMLRNPADGTAISVEIRKWDIDTSLTDEVQVEMSFDLTPTHDGELYWEFYNSLPKFEHTDAWIQIHRVYSGINAVPDTCATKQWVSSNYQPLSGMSSYVAYSAIEHNGDGAISGINGSSIVGELDTDTVSAIASSYAESAASSKQDMSAMTAYATTGDLLNYVPGSAYTAYTAHVETDKLDASASSWFYPTSNPSGFITGVDQSSLSSLIDYSALEYDGSGHISGISGSAIGGQGGTDSATVSAIASAYAESAASGKLDNSASSTWYPMNGNPSGFLTAHQDISNKLDTSAFNAYSAGVDTALADKLDKTAYDSAKYQSEFRPWASAPTSGSLVMEQSRYPRMVQAIISGTGGSATAGIVPPVPAQDPEAVRVLVAASGSLADVTWQDVNTYVSSKADVSSMTSYMPYSSLGYSGTVITSIDGSAIGGQGGEGHEYTGVYPVVVDNTADTISVSNIPLCLETPLSARESAGSAIIGIDLTNYATTAYVDSSVSSKADYSALDNKLDKTAEVVTSTATQLYAGTDYLVSVNNAAISAARAGQAANASLATSAWYDGTGRYISALPDSAAVSAIASAYAESAVSSKQDTLAFAYNTENQISSINGSAIGGQGGGTDSATVSAIASAYAESAASSKQDSSAMSSYALSADVSSTISTVSTNSASWASTLETASATAYKQNGTQLVTFTGVASADTKPLIAQTIQAGAVQSIGTSNFFYGPSAKPFTANTAGIYAPLQYATGACLAMDGGTYRAYFKGNEWFISDIGNNRSGAVRAEVHASRGIHISGSNTAGVGFDLLTTGLNFTNNTGTTSMTPANIAEWKSCHNTVSANSASWGGGGATGDYVEKSATILTIGSNNTALYEGAAIGTKNSASDEAFAHGSNNRSYHNSLSQGYYNTASSNSFALGDVCFAESNSIAVGRHCSASGTSFAQGYYVSSRDKTFGFGQYNLRGNGSLTGNSAAFVIGDGTASNARHDLMLVTKNGEITMYSSTADTTGTGVMSSIRALSASVGNVTALLDSI